LRPARPTGMPSGNAPIPDAAGNSRAEAGRNIAAGIAPVRSGKKCSAPARSRKSRERPRRLRPPGPEFRAALPRARVCSAGLDAVLVLAKRKKRGKSDCKADEKRRLLYQGLDARRRAFTPEIPKLPKPARPIAAELGVAVARDAVFVAAGLRGAPLEVVDQRLAAVPDDDFREAVRQLMATG
jgi:hypothetical protein